MDNKEPLVSICIPTYGRVEILHICFFSFGIAKQKSNIEIYDSFDTFLNLISYYSTWSSIFGSGKDNFGQLIKK